MIYPENRNNAMRSRSPQQTSLPTGNPVPARRPAIGAVAVKRRETDPKDDRRHRPAGRCESLEPFSQSCKIQTVKGLSGRDNRDRDDHQQKGGKASEREY